MAFVRPTTALLLASLAAQALGQTIPTGWDAKDPVNKAELRTFLATAYAYQQAGQEWPELDLFTFTNMPPDHRGVMMAPAVEVFGELYKHRVDPWGLVGTPYSVFDLLAADPVVAAKFRHYTLTGEFLTDANDDPQVVMKHLQMAIEAVTQSTEYKLESYIATANSLKTYDLEKQPTPPPPAVPAVPLPPPVVVPPGLQQFDCDLRAWVKRSLLACMFSKDLYKGENIPGTGSPNPRGRFDCDDFSNAMLYWLIKNLKGQYPGMDPRVYAFYWKCPKLDAAGNPELDAHGNPIYIEHGHAVAVIIIDGKYYLIDPYTGTTYGPYDTLKQVQDAAFHNARHHNMLCLNWTPGITPVLYPPGRLPIPAEPPPWWEWKDMQQRFCTKLKACCSEIPTWYTPPTTCTPISIPGRGTPGAPTSPCDNIKDFMPPGTFIDPSVTCQ